MTRVFAVANQKGGVGKTTTAVSLSAALAAAERRTLLIDADPQGNASSGVGAPRQAGQPTTYDAILDPDLTKSAIVKGVQFPALDVLPATADLAAAEIELVSELARELRMRQCIERVRGEYDYVLIDCPPSLGLLTVNVLAAADAVLIPLQCEYYALEGLSQLMRTIEMIQRAINPGLVVDGVLLTMYDTRLNLSRQVAEDARVHFANVMFDTVIPRNIRLAEAPSFCRPIISYDIASPGAQAYLAAAGELIRRTEGEPSAQLLSA